MLNFQFLLRIPRESDIARGSGIADIFQFLLRIPLFAVAVASRLDFAFQFLLRIPHAQRAWMDFTGNSDLSIPSPDSTCWRTDWVCPFLRLSIPSPDSTSGASSGSTGDSILTFNSFSGFHKHANYSARALLQRDLSIPSPDSTISTTQVY